MKKMILNAAMAILMLVAAPAFAQSSMGSSMMVPTSDLWVGSTGSDVVNLQTILVSKGYLTMPAGVSMGYFGPLTKAALKEYQASVNVPSTGYFGPITRAAWNTSMSMNASSSSSDMGASAQVGVMVGGALMTPDRDIVQNALNADNVTTVVAAVKAAGLVSTLEGTGPFTVFAPDNNAFAKLPAGTVANLLLPANKAELVDLLTYHVVAGRYTSASLYDGEKLTTVEGKTLTIGKSANGQITVNGTAMVETPDVISSNGVTFVIDTVLMPPTN